MIKMLISFVLLSFLAVSAQATVLGDEQRYLQTKVPGITEAQTKSVLAQCKKTGHNTAEACYEATKGKSIKGAGRKCDRRCTGKYGRVGYFYSDNQCLPWCH